MQCGNVTIRTCRGHTYTVRADFGHRRTKVLEDHPYCLDQTKLVLHEDCGVEPGWQVKIDNAWWTIEAIIDRVGSLVAVQLCKPVPNSCPVVDVIAIRLTMKPDGGMPTEMQISQHFGLFWPVEGGISDSHDAHSWMQITRIYFLDQLPQMTSLTHLRVNGTTWKPLSTHDDGNYHRIPYIRAVHDPWPTARK